MNPIFIRFPSIVHFGRTRGNTNPLVSREAKNVSAIITALQSHEFVASQFNVSEEYVDKCCFDAAVKLINDNKRGRATIDDISTHYKVDNEKLRNEIEDIAIRRFNLPSDYPDHITEKRIEVELGINHSSFRRIINNLRDGLPKHRDDGRPPALSKENQINAFAPLSKENVNSSASRFTCP